MTLSVLHLCLVYFALTMCCFLTIDVESLIVDTKRWSSVVRSFPLLAFLGGTDNPGSSPQVPLSDAKPDLSRSLIIVIRDCKSYTPRRTENMFHGHVPAIEWVNDSWSQLSSAMDGFTGACQVTPIPCFIDLRDWLSSSLHLPNKFFFL